MEAMDVGNPTEDQDADSQSTEHSIVTDLEKQKIEDDFEETKAEDDDNDEEAADAAEVKKILAKLEQSDYDYYSHVALIEKFGKMGELEKLREARESMSAKFPLSEELWLAWIRDEIKLATTPEEKTHVTDLCERAIKDYLSIDVWLEYLQFSIGIMGTDESAVTKVRDLFERALTTAGLSIVRGAIIWEAYREYESVLLQMIKDEDELNKREQVDRIGTLFRKQLSVPLLDMDKTYQEYITWRAGEGEQVKADEKTVKKLYEKALEQLNERLPFEEKVTSAENDDHLLDAYNGYLLYEKEKGTPTRVLILYERAVAALSLSISLWEDYMNYAESIMKNKDKDTLHQVYYKASRNVPWCPLVWKKWIRAYEKWKKPVLEVQELLEEGLKWTYSLMDDYRDLWLLYLEYLRRRINDNPETKEKAIETIRKAFDTAYKHLNSLGEEGDPSCIVLQFFARTEAIHCDNMVKARELWYDILNRGNSEYATFWLEFISLERRCGDEKHARKLFIKALTASKDWPQSIASAWLDFERDHGTLEDIKFCEKTTKTKLEEFAKNREEEEQNMPAEKQNGTSPKKKPIKRKANDEGKWKNNASTTPHKMSRRGTFSKNKNEQEKNGSKITISPPPGFGSKISPEGFDSKIPPPPGFESRAETSEENKMEVETPVIIDDELTVFVSNLSYELTEEEIREVFKTVGPIEILKIVRDNKKRSKGYCYAQFNNVEAVQKALKLDRTLIKERPMFVSKCDPDRATRAVVFRYNSELEKNKLFVKGLPKTTKKEELEKIFEKYGTLKEIRLVTFRNGFPKGIAYVEYEDEISASNAIIATDGMHIRGKIATVALSHPPKRGKNFINDENIPAHLVKSLGGSSSSRSHTGQPKTMLSMIPSSVKRNAENVISADTDTPDKITTPPKTNEDFRKLLLNKD